LFDLPEAERRKLDGMSAASLSQKRATILVRAREVAVSLAHKIGEVTADDVYAELVRDGWAVSELGNAAGSIFKGGFVWTEKWAKSERTSNHARVNRVWRLK